MTAATPQQQGVQSTWRPETTNNEFNALVYLVQTLMSSVNVATVVEVVAVRSNGPMGAIGTVDVRPLVEQVDGQGTAWPHATVYNIPFFRLQGGLAAVVMDPVVGDVGLAVICDQDTSAVKGAGRPAPPPTRRRWNYSDGVYLGAILSYEGLTTFVQLRNGTVSVRPFLEVQQGNISINDADLHIQGHQLLTAQQPAIPDAVGSSTSVDNTPTLNAILAMLRVHGIIAT